MDKLLVLCLVNLLTLAASVSARSISPLNLHEHKPTSLRFFWHNKYIGPNATAEIVARSSATDVSPTNFGNVFVFDDPLTVEPDPSSQIIGKAQGMYVFADRKVSAVLMVMTFAFSAPEYDGSTLVVEGRNEISLSIREMPIVGGSGVFRFAAGYVQASPSFDDTSAGIFIVEYNCFITYAEHRRTDI